MPLDPEVKAALDRIADNINQHRAADNARFEALEAGLVETNATLTRAVDAQNTALAGVLRAVSTKPAGRQATGEAGEGGEDDPAEYADPGYQPDKKPRYPLSTEKEIRAAWSYIHEGRDEDKYTARQVREIEGRIVEAWKAKIDPKGPPEAKAGETRQPVKPTADRQPDKPDKPAAKGERRAHRWI